MRALRSLRRLAPLLAAVVVACNISESSNEQAAFPAPGAGAEAVAFAPRIVAAGGKLPQSDSVYLTLSTRAKASDPWQLSKTFSKSWLDSGVKVEGLTIGLQWKAEVAGVNNGGDTLWKGTDTGSIASAAAVSRNLADTAGQLLHVRQLAAKPSLANIATTLAAGTVVTLPEGRIAHTWGKDNVPNCSTDSITATVTPDAQHSVLNLRACGDSATQWPSSVTNIVFTVVVKPSKISLGDSLLVTSSTPAQRVWNTPVTLSIPSGTTLSWEISLGSQTEKGSGSSLLVPAAFFAKLPAKDSIFPVTARILLKDSTGTPIDSANLRWILKVPVTPTPQLTHSFSRNYDTLVFSWDTKDSTHLTVGSSNAGGSSTVSSFRHPGESSYLTKVAPHDLVSAKLVAISTATGRVSDTARDSLRAPQAPAVPGFAATNTDSVNGTVTVQLDAATRAQEGTLWMVGWKPAGSRDSISFQPIDTLSGTRSWSRALNSGTIVIAVRAVRDGVTKDFSTELTVTRTAAARTGAPLGLAVSSRTDTSITWSWNRVPGRKYRIFAGSSPFATADSLAAAIPGIPAMVDSTEGSSYTISGKPAGSKWHVAVVALSGVGDSSGGNSDPSIHGPDSTRRPPPAPKFTAVASDPSAGELTVEVSNSQGCTGKVGVSTNGSDWTFSELTGSVWKSTGLTGSIHVQVILTRDSLDSSALLPEPVSVGFTGSLTPGKVTGLALQSRTYSSLTWTWDAQPRHSYTVFFGTGSVPTDVSTAQSKSADNGTFTLGGLRDGDEGWIAVLAHSQDSTASTSTPVVLGSAACIRPQHPGNAALANTTSGLVLTYSRLSGETYTVSTEGTANGSFASLKSPDTLSLSEGTYSVKLTVSRDGYDTSVTFPSQTLVLPGLHAHAPPTGLKFAPSKKDGVGDTAFDISWDARSGVQFELSVKNNSSSASPSVFTVSTNQQRAKVQAGSSYTLSLVILGNSDSALKSSPLTLTTSARTAPTAPIPASAVWDKESQTLVVTLSSSDTSVASYNITDDSALLAKALTIANTWSGAGEKPALPLTGLSTTVRNGNAHINVQAIGKNGVLSSLGSIAAHIPQQRVLTHRKATSWAVGATVKLRHLDTLFQTTPDSIHIQYQTKGMATNYSTSDTLMAFSPSLDLDIKIGTSTNLIPLSFQGRWANGDTTLLTDPNVQKDTVKISMAGAGTEGYWAPFLEKIATTDEGGKQSVMLSQSAGIAVASYLFHNTGSTWSPMDPGMLYYKFKVDSIAIQPFSHTYGPAGVNDTAERIARPFFPDSLYDERDQNTYPVTVIDGKAWMTQNLRYDAPGGDEACYLNSSSHCTQSSTSPLYGRLYTISQALGIANSTCDTLPNTGLSTGSAGCKDSDLRKENDQLQGLCPSGWHLPSTDEWSALATLGLPKLLDAANWNSNPNLSNKITEDNTQTFSELFVRYGQRVADDPSFSGLSPYEFAPASDVRSFHWAAPNSTSIASHTTSGIVFQPDNRKGTFVTVSSYVYYYLPQSVTNMTYAQRLAYPIRCTRN